MPVLLRQYLRLGDEVLAFNVDPAFSGALDALLVLDLVRADTKALGRYMGLEKLEEYRAFHVRTRSR